jgi:hypothetical protein
MHEPIDVLGELRLVDMPIYHCELLLADAHERRVKRERYEARRPSLRNGDFPVNLHYTPEDWGEVATSDTPAADRELVERVRIAGPRDSAEPPGSPLVSLREAERYVGARELSPDAYDASVRIVRPPESVPAGFARQHEVVVTNLGDEPWQWGDHPPHVRLGYRWLRPDGGVALEDRCLFTETVMPGATTRMLAPIHAPPPGSYVLSVDVVHEDVRWFSCAADYPVEVTPSSESPDPARV